MLKVIDKDTTELRQDQIQALAYLDEARASILDPKFRSLVVQVVRDPDGDPAEQNMQLERWLSTRHDVSLLEMSGALLEAAISSTPTGIAHD